MNTKTIAVIAIVLVLGIGYAVAKPADNNLWNSMMGGIGGMMGWNGNYGMMGNGNGYNGMMSGGMMGQNTNHGMMGNGNGYKGMMSGGMMGSAGTGYCGGSGSSGIANKSNATPITIQSAKDSVDKYLVSTSNDDLAVAEVIEFENNFYAGVKEKSTGTYAFELLVNKYTGVVYPEMGPNMMWNAKYGHMKLKSSAEATISKEQALKIAQEYLDKALPGIKTGDADAFYGYYTIEVLKDGKIYGMLSVNTNSGAVWYHNWHGNFVNILEVDKA
jgi:hypothetical protein